MTSKRKGEKKKKKKKEKKKTNDNDNNVTIKAIRLTIKQTNIVVIENSYCTARIRQSVHPIY